MTIWTEAWEDGPRFLESFGGKNMRIGKMASFVAIAAIASLATYQVSLEAG
jgi:hypothetical protein